MKTTYTYCALMAAFVLGTIATAGLSGCQQQPRLSPSTTTESKNKDSTDAGGKKAADKKAADKKAADEQDAADKKAANEKAAADKKAADKKAADKKAADKKAADKKAADEKAAADKKAADEKAAADKKAADKKAADKKAADKKAADEKAAADKKAADKKAAEKKAADEKAAADKKAAEKKATDKKATEKKAADKKAPADKKAADEKTDKQAAADGPVDAVVEQPLADVGTVSASIKPVSVDKRNPVIRPGDWTQWGGNSLRNNTPIAKSIPIEWEIGDFDRKTGDWIKDDAVNIKWVSRLGSQTYGNAVVGHGKVLIGTNNSAGYIKRYPANVDLGCLICFRESDGKFLWQHSSEKLPTGRVHDWPLQGICCAPYVDGDRVWFVTSRGTVVCADLDGYYDGTDDGPVKSELGRLFTIRKNDDPAIDQFVTAVNDLSSGQLSEKIRPRFEAAGMPIEGEIQVKADKAGSNYSFSAKVHGTNRDFKLQVRGPNLNVFKVITVDDKQEADTIWALDMMKEMQVSQHNMCSCSITALGDILFVNTSNGVDESHINIPSPDAPSFIAINRNTGKVYWTDKSPGLNILHGQWSSPTVGFLGGVPQVIFGGGDGWVYSFRADEGKDGKPELLWKFDANPKESKWILGGRGTRNNIIATPVIHENRVYVAVGQDPEHGEGVGHLWCLDPTKRGDVSPQLAVDAKTKKPIAHQRLQAVISEQGQAAIDNGNTAVIWHYSAYDQNADGEIDFEEQMHRSCGTVAIKDNLLFIADFSGLFHCLDARTGKVHWTYDMLAAAWGSPLIINGHVYIGDEDGDLSIFKLSPEKHEPVAEINMGNSIYSTPIVANDVLFISNKTHLFAIDQAKPAAE